jgi:hypothetical protein
MSGSCICSTHRWTAPAYECAGPSLGKSIPTRLCTVLPKLTMHLSEMTIRRVSILKIHARSIFDHAGAAGLRGQSTLRSNPETSELANCRAPISSGAAIRRTEELPEQTAFRTRSPPLRTVTGQFRTSGAGSTSGERLPACFRFRERYSSGWRRHRSWRLHCPDRCIRRPARGR